jgi:hypothetical protein
LTDVNLLPIPSFTDPFALSWSFGRAAAPAEDSSESAEESVALTPQQSAKHVSLFYAHATNTAAEVARMQTAHRQLKAMARRSPLLSESMDTLEQNEVAQAVRASREALRAAELGSTGPTASRQVTVGENWQLLCQALYPDGMATFVRQIMRRAKRARQTKQIARVYSKATDTEGNHRPVAGARARVST